MDAGTGGQEAQERFLALHHHRGAALPHEWSIADELKGIAQALLGEQQDGLTLKARSVPARLTEKRPRKPPTLPSPLVLGPPRFEVIPEEPGIGQIQMGIG